MWWRKIPTRRWFQTEKCNNIKLKHVFKSMLHKHILQWKNIKTWSVHKIFFFFQIFTLSSINPQSNKYSRTWEIGMTVFYEKIMKEDFIWNNFEMLWKWLNHSDSRIEPKPLGTYFFVCTINVRQDSLIRQLGLKLTYWKYPRM